MMQSVHPCLKKQNHIHLYVLMYMCRICYWRHRFDSRVASIQHGSPGVARP